MASSGTEVLLASDDDHQIPEELKPLHDYYKRETEEMRGSWSKLVIEKVNDIWSLNPRLKISRCIVIGHGGFEFPMKAQRLPGDLPNEEFPLASGVPTEVKQFMVLRITMDYIKKAAHPIETYFQDPCFTKLDKAYLEYHGYKVLEGTGFDMVDSTTFLFNMKCTLKKPQALAIFKASPVLYAGLSCEMIIKGWVLRLQHQKRSFCHANGEEGFSFDSPVDSDEVEEYMNITNVYDFPPLQRDPFLNFDIRVVKTVHKDHQSS